ncbi:small ribosomal subunit protein bTHXm [Humulus lupulus]|uniref:small ribosomal subunit protein bTHXm n=1 Tax=Humulus lupulus TaxID=3486 RepID=UPI002B416B92|nr:small ribosomal subunit protein bTHXm [Humulus lupulus]
MAMIQWCGAIARRMVMTEVRRPPFMAPSSMSFSAAAGASAGGIGVPILCGRGDKKTKKGKRFKGSYGNSRPKKEKKIERIKDKVEVPRSTPWPLPFKLI